MENYMWGKISNINMNRGLGVQGIKMQDPSNLTSVNDMDAETFRKF